MHPPESIGAARPLADTDRPTTAHLRSRGDHDVVVGLEVLGGGSPPLARRGPGPRCGPGDGPPPPARRPRPRPASQLARRRFTSARAETTGRPWPRPPFRTAHLRLRGAHHQPPHREGADPRFTSASAERTAFHVLKRLTLSVHLRLRGEDASDPAPVPWPTGSPPPPRRGRGSRRAAARPERFTSARAERTPSDPMDEASMPAHLRSRGEHWMRGLESLPVTGSPPLARRGPFSTCSVRSALPIRDQGTPVMHPPKSIGAARPLAGTDRPTTAHSACAESAGRTVRARTR